MSLGWSMVTESVSAVMKGRKKGGEGVFEDKTANVRVCKMES